MIKKMIFWWIDDSSDRQKTSANLARHLGIEVYFSNVSNKDLLFEIQKELSAKFNTRHPDLIIVDHKLQNVSQGMIETGSSLSEILREHHKGRKYWLSIPIVCISAVDPKDVPLQEKLVYEDFFNDANFNSKYSTLSAIARAFQFITKKSPQNIDDLLKLIAVPKEEIERIKSIIPDNLKKKSDYKDKSLPITISRWIRHTLLKRPGFLYDQLWVATLLGIKENSFKKIERIFDAAKYNGIFAVEDAPRWWPAEIREILYSKFPKDPEVFPWKLGRKLRDINQEDYSKCDFCGKDFPEIVGYSDEISEKRKQMHIRCTIEHPGFKNSLYFEKIRMMKQG